MKIVYVFKLNEELIYRTHITLLVSDTILYQMFLNFSNMKKKTKI